MILAGCRGRANETAAREVALGSCSLSLEAAASDEEAIWALIAAEGQYVVSQDIEALLRLWAPDGIVTDAKHSRGNPEDDQSWQGTDAIRYRYQRIVFPSAPMASQPADLDIRVDGDRAIVVSTTRIGEEVSPTGDRWEAVKRDGCWLLQRLDFNLEPP